MAKEKKIETLRQLSIAELKDKSVLARKALFDLKIKKSEVKNLHTITSARREVARILTIIKEKELSGSANQSK